jgi:hypothetical protein
MSSLEVIWYTPSSGIEIFTHCPELSLDVVAYFDAEKALALNDVDASRIMTNKAINMFLLFITIS